jgi:cell wall-associated NlpC family hydrolase
MQVARQFASRLIAHRNKLAGKAEDALVVQFALHQTAEGITEHGAEHKAAAGTALEHWDGAASERFETRSRRLGRQLRETGEAGRQAERIVAETAATLDAGHATAQRLVDEYVTRAAQAIDAGLAVSGAGAPAAVMQAVATASDLEEQYAKESVANLRKVNAELTEAAHKLRALKKHVEHDGIADPGDRKHHGHKHDSHKHDSKRDGGSTKPANSKRVHDILAAARKELGTGESPPGSNRNPYGPTAPWCSSFATAMWRRAGVDIPILPFTGAVYEWGVDHGKAYGKHNLDQVRPGDVLLFGTGPSSPSTSTHIGIVEKVDGNTVTLIEGNSGDHVQRNTHRLSSSTFYGGVHP